MRRIAFPTVVAVVAGRAQPAFAQGLSRPKDVQITAHVVVTEPLPETDQRIAGRKPPPGFHIATWADRLDTPRLIPVAPNGDVDVSSLQNGTLTLLRGDERPTSRSIVREKKNLQGLAIHDGQMFSATDQAMLAATIKAERRHPAYYL